MQKIKGLLPPKGVSITEDQWQWCLQEMNSLNIKTFSGLIRHLIDRSAEIPEEGVKAS